MSKKIIFTAFTPKLTNEEIEYLTEDDANIGYGGVDVIITKKGFYLLDVDGRNAKQKHYLDLAERAREACKD